ncbi:MAG: hypothetical protein ACLSX0_04625 [Anaerostipes caccae]
MKEALSEKFENWKLGYSFKTNSLPFLCEYMRDCNCLAEVVSFDEYNLAISLGYPKKNIIYNGPMKNKETFIDAITSEAIVNIETIREVEWLKCLDNDKLYKVGIRINFDIEKMCPGESSCGDEGGRFGFCLHNGELNKAIKTIDSLDNIEINGIHLHTSSKTRSLNVYRAIANIAKEIIDEFALKLQYIDIGGGFFGGLEGKPTYKEYMEEVAFVLGDYVNDNKITLIIEPGASIIASPVSFVTSVIDVKRTNRNIFITTNGSRNDIDPFMTKSNYFYNIESHSDNKVVDKQIISGFTCMENDRIFCLKNYKLLQEGDIIRYNKVGSYTMCLSPLFIKYFPAVYIKRMNGRIECVRKKWSVNEFLGDRQRI